jgi:predicted MPP superfamily phosphohydrolase
MIVILLVYLLAELYVFLNLRIVIRESKHQLLYYGLYIFSVAMVIFAIGSLMYNLNNPSKEFVPRTLLTNLFIGFTFALIVSKLILASIFLLIDVSRLITWIIDKVVKMSSSNAGEISIEGRRSFLIKVGLGLAAIPFASFLYGITKGKYNYKVRKISLTFDNLDPAFDGYRIVQISDVHAGSFDSPEQVQKGIDMMNEQQPDLVLFTGDLVNDRAEEIDAYADVFRNIEAKDGIYSITGNHDYGDYYQWDSTAAKEENFKNLVGKHADLGFKILMNENVKIQKGDAHFNLLGIENWGLPPFPQHGDLNKALQGVDEQFTLLMSHDPSHWDAETVKHKNQIDLTLSGHTHGMQFGIEIPGIRWSPVKYKYPRWAGLYEKGVHKLYVNRGFGFLGLPGRVGIWPELTMIELKSGKLA